MKKNLLFLVLMLFVTTGTWAANITVGPGGPPTYQYATIQAAVNAAGIGDVINVAAGTYIESNILIDKSLTIQGVGATRNDVVIVPAAEDGNADNAFGNSAQNGFIIKAHAVTIRKLTINGQGNPGLTPGKNNFRTGVVTLDASQAGGGAWNNLHVDNVVIKYAWRRGISVFPRTVSGTVIENSSVENIAYNQGMYLAGHSLALNNTIINCFQGIVQNPDATTPTGLFKMNGNTLTGIGNFPGCFNFPNGQPRAIQFDPVDPTFRTVEIKNNNISDGLLDGSPPVTSIGTVGIYTRRANSASLVENNTITLSSGSSISTGGTQSVGMLLGWSYSRGFTARLNNITSTGYGIGIMLVDVGTSAMPMILEGNILISSSSAHIGRGDGTGIFISNEYLFNSADKAESFVKIQNQNSITGFARGIDVEKVPTSTLPLTVIVHNNSIAGNTTGIDASTLSAPINAAKNWWGDCSGPGHVTNPGGIGNPVTNNVSFIPWWCDPIMTIPAPALLPGMAILNATTGAQFPASALNIAFAIAMNGETLYVTGTVEGTSYNFPGKTVYINGPGTINGTFQSALTIQAGNLIVDGVTFSTQPLSIFPAIVVYGGTLKLRNCIIESLPPFGSPCIEVNGGTVDAGTSEDNGLNHFIAAPIAINNIPLIGLHAIGNDWGSPTGPTIATNPSGTGGAIIGAGQDSVYYAPFAGAPVSTIASVFVCYGVPTVDIPITADNFNSVGSIALTFGFTPAQLTNPQLVYVNPAFGAWGPFTVTTDGGLIAAGTFKVSGFGPLPGDGVTLPDGSILFTLRFDILPNLGTNSTAPVFFNEDPQGTACEYAGVAPSYHPFNDIPTSTYYLNGGVTLNGLQKISGVFTYYNNANTVLTDGDITVTIYKSSDVGHLNLLGTAITNGSGYYEFQGLCPDETYDIVATSTHTTEGSVNTTDAAQVNYWPTAPYIIEKVRFYAGDVGTMVPYVLPDWNLTATDAQRIQQNFVNGKAFDRPWTFWRTNKFINANPATEAYPTVNIPVGGDVTANMYGLCTGDFNRSFNPLLKKAPSATLSLIYGRSMLISANQEFDLPIRVVHPSSIGAVSLILNFPPDLVDVNDVLFNSADGQFDWTVIGDQIRIGWNSMFPADLAAYEDILTLKLKTKETFTTGNTIKLTLAADPLNELANDRYEVIGDAILSVDVVDSSPYGIGEKLAGDGIKIYNYPNPATSYTTFAYALPFTGQVVLEIRNALGETVKILTNETQVFGNHALKFNASGIAPGIYTATIRLSNGTEVVSTTIKFVISK
ncbi:MAG: T9SS type A sorting domain-containing protein [Bacteroidales bacterium]|nr:T9SS type A sorting domain-containing protein [Bacteroidales bacterium]